MKNIRKIALMAILLAAALPLTLGAGGAPKSFSPHVDGKGNITLPSGFRSAWAHLGTWVKTASIPASPAGHDPGFHDVYAPPESVKAFLKDGQWPDGTILVKEIRALKWDDLPTGHVMYADDVSEWFVMVRDLKGRFPGNPNWGDGWGWARFTAADRAINAAANYKEDCMSCHDLAKDTNWVFVRGYPTLR